MVVTGLADAHRFGCHRWHACPSNHGTYVCGDLGYCSQCPDNAYCLGRFVHEGVVALPRRSPDADAASR